MKARSVVHTKNGTFYGKANECNDDSVKELENFFENFRFNEVKHLKIETYSGFIFFNPENVIGVEIEMINY